MGVVAMTSSRLSLTACAVCPTASMAARASRAAFTIAWAASVMTRRVPESPNTVTPCSVSNAWTEREITGCVTPSDRAAALTEPKSLTATR